VDEYRESTEKYGNSEESMKTSREGSLGENDKRLAASSYNCNRNILQHENVSGAAAHEVVSRDLLYVNVLICRVEPHAQCAQPGCRAP
jgi:hypothetical protein